MTDRIAKAQSKNHRTCRDRLRARMLEAGRRRGSDPAVSVVLQLLALFTVAFGRVSVLPETFPVAYEPPPMSPNQARRNDIARRLGVPKRYVDIAMANGQVPYPLLFDHVRRGGATRADAISVLLQRIPEAAVDWVKHIRKWGLWSELLRCYVHQGSEDETNVQILRATLAWLNGREGGTGGPDGPGMALTPNGSGNSDDPNNDPKSRKP